MWPSDRAAAAGRAAAATVCGAVCVPLIERILAEFWGWGDGVLKWKSSPAGGAPNRDESAKTAPLVQLVAGSSAFYFCDIMLYNAWSNRAAGCGETDALIESEARSWVGGTRSLWEGSLRFQGPPGISTSFLASHFEKWRTLELNAQHALMCLIESRDGEISLLTSELHLSDGVPTRELGAPGVPAVARAPGGPASQGVGNPEEEPAERASGSPVVETWMPWRPRAHGVESRIGIVNAGDQKLRVTEHRIALPLIGTAGESFFYGCDVDRRRLCPCGGSSCAFLVSAYLAPDSEVRLPHSAWLYRVDVHGRVTISGHSGRISQPTAIQGTSSVLFFDERRQLVCMDLRSDSDGAFPRRVLLNCGELWPDLSRVECEDHSHGFHHRFGVTVDVNRKRIAVLAGCRFFALPLPPDLVPPPRCDPRCGCANATAQPAPEEAAGARPAARPPAIPAEGDDAPPA